MRFVPFAYIVLCLVSFAYSLPVPVGRGKAASESRLQTRNAPTITKFESFTFTGVPFESGKDSDFRKKDARDIVTKGIKEKTSLSAPHKDVPWTWSTKEGNGDGRHAGYCDVYVGKDKVATFHYQLKKSRRKEIRALSSRSWISIIATNLLHRFFWAAFVTTLIASLPVSSAVPVATSTYHYPSLP
ncbi:hypothetical protein EV360DRAFT_79066 [Lentinula raphanica]|nr:hypothetical protein EV360DRAFT_79066 [Lentinula raphanica]